MEHRAHVANIELSHTTHIEVAQARCCAEISTEIPADVLAAKCKQAAEL
eukprot:CAMPEP_0115876842 /NCGR_PEP_ID=MMETSP0287-20121206/25897_1 /TAXON_ID=412157 /ORGANISM="Chrysochromulina rotalis, Strain UIO044" /LENGTH=48 /DNA_ID= /DNA_START= /DNA_END= /DNA_ORIENTATION=